MIRWFTLSLVLTLSCSLLAEDAANFSPEQLEFFEKDVRPLLVARCYQCHSGTAKKILGGLRVDGRQWLLKGGDTGPAIDTKTPLKSLLVDAINYGETYQMPPKSKLPASEIATLTKWVEMGSPWPASEEKAIAKDNFDLAARKAAHWCWQPLTSPPLPVVKNTAWPQDSLDRFILAPLEAKGFQPAAPTDRRTLLRRLYFDIIGLPPSPEQMQTFLADPSPEAVTKVVDVLLKSPQFGERWARHWLDLVRYAESRGHEFDYPVANPQQYRDYIIRALQQDLPYNQFVTEHVAGDLLTKPRLNPEQGFNESILGTGFWFFGEWIHSPVDIRKDEADRYDNMVDVFSKSFLGLTIACARCHDHKFDAITQKDYYALFGYLQSTAYRQVRIDTMLAEEQQARVLAALNQQSSADLARSTAATLQPAVTELPQYLLAVREVLQAHPEKRKKEMKKPEENNELNESILATVKKIASEKQVDEKRLAAWVLYLTDDANKPRDIFHTWLQAALEKRPKEDAEFKTLGAMANHWKTLVTNQAENNKNATIVDYSNAAPQDWLQNGVSFGIAPAQVGDLIYSSHPTQPLADVAWFPSAQRDPTWNGLKPAGDTDQDTGRLGGFDRAGKTIRTPTFTVGEGPVHYLVQGHGMAYAVVDSHAVIHGPLHGQIVIDFQKGDDSLRWITHNLSAYKGHRIHIEFAPAANADLRIAKVMQGTAPLPPANEPASALLATKLDAATIKTMDDLAKRYQLLFNDSLKLLAENKLATSTDHAALISWLLTHPQLLPAQPETTRNVFSKYLAEREEITTQIKWESRYAMAMWEGSPEDEVLMIRGNHRLTSAAVPRRLPEALAGPNAVPNLRGSGRLELAQQLVDPNISPFTPRVMVNRVWYHLFGRGLVPSVDNFGVLGSKPTHPELLDHLSTRFINEGWSLKQLIRTIVLSRTYQMASTLADAKTEEADPNNLLWRRTNIRRLQAEAIRDEILAVSGRLNPKMYGRSVPVALTDFLQGRGRPNSGPVDGDGRRSIYLGTRRNFLSPMLLAFDAPIPFSSMGQRNVSNVPAQALILMNDPFVVQQAEVWAKRVLAEPNRSASERITIMYETAFSRPPTADEIAEATQFLASQAREHGLPGENVTDLRPWTDLAHVLMNVKEFIFMN